MVAKLDLFYLNTKSKIQRKVSDLTKKHAGFSGIIVAVALIVIAIIVVLYFKNKTQAPLEGAVDATSQSITNITTELTGGAGGAGGAGGGK